MDELLYQTDAYLRDFEATVCEVRGGEARLDRTAFFPGGGGQPADRGWLTGPAAEYAVTSLRKADDGIWHGLSAAALAEGDRVRGRLDWDHRYALMRTHTAMHILCGVIWRDYGAKVTGGNMEPLRGRMDFEFESMRQELVREIEEKVRQEVEAARAVRVAFLDREAAMANPDLIRTKINLLPAGIEVVRTVEIVGLDLQADGGTHVANTAEVGPVRIVDYKSKGAINKRIVLQLENPASDREPR